MPMTPENLQVSAPQQKEQDIDMLDTIKKSKAPFDTVTFRYFADTAALIAGFKNGEVDVALEFNHTHLDAITKAAIPQTAVDATDGVTYEQHSWNMASLTKKFGAAGAKAMMEALHYAVDKDEINTRITWLTRAAKAVGVVAAVNGEIIWADIFASPALLQKYWPKLVRSYAAEAMVTRAKHRVPDVGAAQAFPGLSHAQARKLVFATFTGSWEEAHRAVLVPAFRRSSGGDVILASFEAPPNVREKWKKPNGSDAVTRTGPSV